jgi:PTH2 family peptidyl-tRNA hydrolase
MNTKQTIVMRHDLNMRLGKKIAQGSHASMAWLSHLVQENRSLSEEQKAWMEGSFKKICVRVDSEAELLDIYNKAKEKGLEAHLICDSGLTEFHGIPTNTCCAIGPNLDVSIDEITGHLKLL